MSASFFRKKMDPPKIRESLGATLVRVAAIGGSVALVVYGQRMSLLGTMAAGGAIERVGQALGASSPPPWSPMVRPVRAVPHVCELSSGRRPLLLGG